MCFCQFFLCVHSVRYLYSITVLVVMISFFSQYGYDISSLWSLLSISFVFCLPLTYSQHTEAWPSMSSGLQSRVQAAVEQFQKAIHKSIMPLQKDAYLCMAECSDPTKSPDKIERCYQKCQTNIEKADHHIQFVINGFQKELRIHTLTQCLEKVFGVFANVRTFVKLTYYVMMYYAIMPYIGDAMSTDVD